MKFKNCSNNNKKRKGNRKLENRSYECKTNNKTTDPNSTISIIVLNDNGLNIPTIRQKFSE